MTGWAHWGGGVYHFPTDPEDEEAILDRARYDWVIGSVETMEQVEICNRMLQMNPNLKLVIRLWPVNSLGLPSKNYQATFLDYFYKPGVKAAVLANLTNSIRLVLDHLDKPENVVAFTFLEELPGHWGHGMAILDGSNGMPPMLEHYRAEIESERGVPMVFNSQLKSWIGAKFVQSLDEVHAQIKAEIGTRQIYYWKATLTHTLDTSVDGYPYYYDQIVKPGGADGLVIYPLNPTYWNTHMNIVRAKGWPFFSQLSHPSLMRQDGWASTLANVKTSESGNQGYFFYCAGNCRRPHWYDDTTIAPKHNVRTFSSSVHLREFAAQEGIGTAVVSAQARLVPLLDVDLSGRNLGDVFAVKALIHNPKKEGFYTDALAKKATGVVASLSLPPGLSLFSGSASVSVGDLEAASHASPAPGSFAVATWQVQVTGPIGMSESTPLAVSVTSSNTASGFSALSEIDNYPLPTFQSRTLVVSGQGWNEPGFRLSGDLAPVIVMDSKSHSVFNPSLTDSPYETVYDIGTWEDNALFYTAIPTTPLTTNPRRITFAGELPPQKRLVIEGANTAYLYDALVSEHSFLDENDPSGYQAFSSGYLVKSVRVNQQVHSKLKVSLSGKATGGANSLMVMRFKENATGTTHDISTLVDRFSALWKDDLSVEVSVPFVDATLTNIYLYRRNQTGTIWYGDLEVEQLPIPWLEKSYPDAGDPSGYKAHTSGYLILSTNHINAVIEPGYQVEAMISGKKEGGAVNSLMVLRFEDLDYPGTTTDRSVLVNRFGTTMQWGLSETINPPFARSLLKSVYLYRYPSGSSGTIWYANAIVRRKGGKDVGAQLTGEIPLIRAGVNNVMTYFDENEDQSSSGRVEVKLSAP